LEVQYKEAVLTDAQRLCQSFASRFTDKLPLELRDMVYSYVWPVESFQWVESYGHLVLNSHLDLDAVDHMRRKSDINRALKVNAPWLLSCKGDSCRCFFWWDHPIWVQPAFVGQQVAKEAAAAYYRTTPMCMEQHFDVRDMETFMLHDRFHVDIRPADHLRQLQFWIESTEKNELGTWVDGCISRDRLPDLVNYLKPLLKIRLKRGFRLTIHWSDLDMESGYELAALRPIVRPLRDAGAHVEVLSSIYGTRGAYDVSDFYELSLSEWQSKWQHAASLELDSSSESDESSELEDDEAFSDLEDEETDSLQSSGPELESEMSNESSSSEHVSVDGDESMTIQAAPEPVIYALAERARADPALRDLIEVVAAGEASREQLQTFEEHMQQLRAEAEADGSN
jgi:hypothetical protein